MNKCFYLDICLINLGFCQLFVPVCGQPNPGQRPLFGQHKVGVEHFWTTVLRLENRKFYHFSLTPSNSETYKTQSIPLSQNSKLKYQNLVCFVYISKCDVIDERKNCTNNMQVVFNSANKH